MFDQSSSPSGSSTLAHSLGSEQHNAFPSHAHPDNLCSMLGSLSLLCEDTNQLINEQNYSWTLIILGIYLTMKVVAFYQTEKLFFYYNRSSKLMNEFLNKSKIKDFSYTPHWVTLNGTI